MLEWQLVRGTVFFFFVAEERAVGCSIGGRRGALHGELWSEFVVCRAVAFSQELEAITDPGP